MSAYNPANWYWIVAGSASQVWSSASCSYVPITDAAYTAWLAAGMQPTMIASAGELHDVLMSQWAHFVQSAGVQITSAAAPTLNATYSVRPDVTAKATALATGIAAGKPVPGGGSTFNYPDITNAMHAFTAANFLNFAAAIETFLYDFEQSLSTLLNGGSATMPSLVLTIP
jgi:hypothetical protein